MSQNVSPLHAVTDVHASPRAGAVEQTLMALQ
jgi:hypothetical protein